MEGLHARNQWEQNNPYASTISKATCGRNRSGHGWNSELVAKALFSANNNLAYTIHYQTIVAFDTGHALRPKSLLHNRIPYSRGKPKVNTLFLEADENCQTATGVLYREASAALCFSGLHQTQHLRLLSVLFHYIVHSYSCFVATMISRPTLEKETFASAETIRYPAALPSKVRELRHCQTFTQAIWIETDKNATDIGWQPYLVVPPTRHSEDHAQRNQGSVKPVFDGVGATVSWGVGRHDKRTSISLPLVRLLHRRCQTNRTEGTINRCPVNTIPTPAHPTAATSGSQEVRSRKRVETDGAVSSITALASWILVSEKQHTSMPSESSVSARAACCPVCFRVRTLNAAR
ncbi:hypothetical protein T265_02824 [Opisthorchis viverrini]|uniref:Uncharacterized protein n=1 Tax=Opisthorchis viverrini TaxID=6198 RepID=A0A074ZTK2_OPIVI|nr:hypothetical protein T265_02824 [Opisthorchis viverrini]KER30783.1 hypothetical protein T265_02824 [Opisthorchis viverrini]